MSDAPDVTPSAEVGADPRRPEGPPTAEPRPVTGAAPGPADTAPTWYLDADHPEVVAYARRVTAGAADAPAAAAALFADVRDRLRYDPYGIDPDPDAFRASRVLAGERAWCVPKAILLSTAARAVGIPARLGFADVRNHLTSPTLTERLGTDLFVYHGYSVLWLEGAWRKASPAFNAELCLRFGTEPLGFDGRGDAMLHPFDGDGNRHMEYVRDRGAYDDLPLAAILGTFAEVYGRVDATGPRHDPAFHG